MDKPKRNSAVALAGMIFTFLVFLASEREARSSTLDGELKRLVEQEFSKDPTSSNKTSENGPSVGTSVFAKVSKSVVVIEALSSAGMVQGSGVVYDNTRSFMAEYKLDIPPDKFLTYLVSNAHVVKNANAVYVLQGGKRYRLDVDYVDDESDLVLLKIHGDLSSISPPFSGTQLKVGEKVFAIGSPYGLENTISEGIISGKREQNGVLLIQTTAPISKGSSGGGLFDEKGRFVGITTFKVKGGENLNFAVDAGRISEIWDAKFVSSLLRVATLDHFSLEEEAIINSDSLTQWLLRTRAENGEKLHAYIRQKYKGGFNSEGRKAFKKEYVQILERFLEDQVGKTANTQNKSETILMVCSVSWGENPMDISLELDYTNRTVNGYPANFTDTEISWTQTWKDKNFLFVLNRYSGSIRIGPKEWPNFCIGQCSQVTEHKF